jgi:hypothetical protein
MNDLCHVRSGTMAPAPAPLPHRHFRDREGQAAAHRGAAIMPRLPSKRHRVGRRLTADWLIVAAFLLLILLAATAGLTAAIAEADSSAVPGCSPAWAADAATNADDYVEGLARLGIARLPCRHRRPW